ncbi:MAG: DUF4388 domain-containing protein [Nitrospirota bacterium]
MALEGSISDFGLADIFQLISLQRKAGELVLTNKEISITVLFDNGMIVGAETTNREDKEKIGRILVRTNKITEKQLKELLKSQKKQNRKLGFVLLDAGLINDNELKEVLQLQLAETVLSLFAWKDGNYSFNQKDIEYDKDIITPLNTEFILMEGIRMLDEWPLIEKNIPSLNIVFAKSEQPPRQKEKSGSELTDFADILLAADDDSQTFTKDEELVLSFIDGKRDAQEIIDLTKLGQFETCKLLSSLYTRQIIDKGEGSTKKVGGGTVLFDFKEAFSSVFKYVNSAALIFILLLLFFYLDVPYRLVNNFNSYKEDLGYLKGYIVRGRLDSIRFSIETFYYENGFYPKNLDTLIAQNYVSKNDLLDPWGMEYNYELLSQKAYKIYSSGTDGKKGTADDIE